MQTKKKKKNTTHRATGFAYFSGILLMSLIISLIFVAGAVVGQFMSDFPWIYILGIIVLILLASLLSWILALLSFKPAEHVPEPVESPSSQDVQKPEIVSRPAHTPRLYNFDEEEGENPTEVSKATTAEEYPTTSGKKVFDFESPGENDVSSTVDTSMSEEEIMKMALETIKAQNDSPKEPEAPPPVSLELTT